MKRRSFLKYSIATGTVLSINAYGSPEFSTKIKKAGVDEFSLNEVTISDLIKSFENGSLTSEKVTKLYLERIIKRWRGTVRNGSD